MQLFKSTVVVGSKVVLKQFIDKTGGTLSVTFGVFRSPLKRFGRDNMPRPAARALAHENAVIASYLGTYSWVNLISASRYFAAQYSATSVGKCGPGAVLSQSSVSR